ncbi:MAG: hypothetical protein ACK4TB_01975 [Gemmobacter sp.]
MLTGTATGEAFFGGSGDDIIRALGGADLLTGGGGADTFVRGAGDRALDCNRDWGDRIVFNAALGATAQTVTVTQTAQGTVIGAAGVAGTMLLSNDRGRIEIGSDVEFDCVPVFGIL